MPISHYEWKEWVDLAEDDAGIGASHKYRGVFCPESMEQAVERARGAGFYEAIPEAERFAERVTAEVDLEVFQTSFQSTWDVAGSEVDMGRFLAGEPECMLESIPFRVARQGRAIRLVVPGCYNSATSTQTVQQRGAAIMALCMILARAQHPVEVWVGYANHGNRVDTRYAYMVRVQRANEPLDEGRVLYALAHPTANRRLCFSVKEHGDAQAVWDFHIVKEDGRYGTSPRDVRPDDLPAADANTIILHDFDVKPDWDEASAIRWVNETLEGLFS